MGNLKYWNPHAHYARLNHLLGLPAQCTAVDNDEFRTLPCIVDVKPLTLFASAIVAIFIRDVANSSGLQKKCWRKDIPFLATVLLAAISCSQSNKINHQEFQARNKLLEDLIIMVLSEVRLLINAIFSPLVALQLELELDLRGRQAPHYC